VPVDREVQPDATPAGRQRQPGDHAQPVTSVPAVQDGSLAARRPGAAHQRLQHQARLVEAVLSVAERLSRGNANVKKPSIQRVGAAQS
jgi:hypothetical protein